MPGGASYNLIIDLEEQGRSLERPCAAMSERKAVVDSMHVLITGGAGYIGSLLTGKLLREGHRVTVLDDLLWGGESLLGYFPDPNFRFAKVNVTEKEAARPYMQGVDAVVHLAAIVGFPACQQVGPQVARLYNVEATKYMYDLADHYGVRRFVFASSYSNYGIAEGDQPVDETSPLNPQSLYAETKIAAEQFLRDQGAGAPCAPILLRFATLFGISPRTRFDLIINQFVLEAVTKGELIIYQRGYNRSFVHVRDVVDAIALVLQAERAKVAAEVFNVGGEQATAARMKSSRRYLRSCRMSPCATRTSRSAVICATSRCALPRFKTCWAITRASPSRKVSRRSTRPSGRESSRTHSRPSIAMPPLSSSDPPSSGPAGIFLPGLALGKIGTTKRLSTRQ